MQFQEDDSAQFRREISYRRSKLTSVKMDRLDLVHVRHYIDLCLTTALAVPVGDC